LGVGEFDAVSIDLISANAEHLYSAIDVDAQNRLHSSLTASVMLSTLHKHKQQRVSDSTIAS
jgi:hypothetical protein